MSDKKNIERLFQEKFKDFEATPSPKVWENIASELEKKENKRRILPFWFNMKAAGIAASLILGYFIADNYSGFKPFNSNSNNTETVVSTESSDNTNTQTGNHQNQNHNVTTNDNLNNSQNNAVVATENNQNTGNSDSNASDGSLVNSNQTNQQNSSLHQNKNIKYINKNQTLQNLDNEIVINAKNKKAKRSKSSEVSKYNTTEIAPVNNSQEQLANSDINELRNSSEQNKTKGYSDKQRSKSKLKKTINKINQNSEAIASNAKGKTSKLHKSDDSNATQNQIVVPNKTNDAIVKNDQPSNANGVNDSNQNQSNTNLPNNPIQNPTLANQTNQNLAIQEVKADSTAVAVVEENALEKILREKELKDKEEKIVAAASPKWKVRPNAAPIFMSASGGSPIDSEFSDNNKDFKNSLSVGLGVDYALSSKFTVRTGINKFDLTYNTNDIEYYADLSAKSSSSARSLPNINMQPQASILVVEDRKAASTGANELAAQAKNEGYLNQQMGYLEVPVEVSYKLLDKKVGIQVITGVSTLFLNKNEVSVVSSGMTTVLGEANNINKVHFSTNIGLGFKYSFWKSFEANFEPTFKYQINAFNASSSQGFKPYIVGLYTGLSFKF